MKSQSENLPGTTRRDFIKTAARTTAIAAGTDLLLPVVYARDRGGSVVILANPSDSLAAQQPVRWAIERLQGRLKDRSVSVELSSSLDRIADRTTCVVVAGTRFRD